MINLTLSLYFAFKLKLCYTAFIKWESSTQHETDLFTHIKGLLYKHVMDSGQKFLAVVIPKSWKYTVLVEAHDKLGHQGNTCTYFLIK